MISFDETSLKLLRGPEPIEGWSDQYERDFVPKG